MASLLYFSSFLTILALSTGAPSGDKCCTEKTVGGVEYRFVRDGMTGAYGCLADCIYEMVDSPGSMYCFAAGDLKVECEDAPSTYEPSNSTGSGPTADILSSLYGYDNCIGGVNSFSSNEEYMADLKRRGCTVVTNSNGQEVTNVAPSQIMAMTCGLSGVTTEWMDGMPVVFNYPLVTQPAPNTLEIELSDGSVVIPTCVVLAPANEPNEQDTLLALGQFGNGLQGTINPVKITVVGDVLLQGPEGQLNAKGVTFANSGDMEYLESSVRMVYARLWDVSDFDEGLSYPGPQPSATYPNSCQYLYPETSHVVKVAFSGGITFDGVTGVQPDTQGIFTVTGATSGQEIPYLGLADLGNTISGVEGDDYAQDGDNYIDICLNISSEELLAQDLAIRLNCDPQQGSVLYPPKGKPFGCQPDKVLLTKDQAFSYFTMAWQTGSN